MGNPIPVERVVRPNRKNVENYEDLQPIAGNMKPAFWVPSENLILGLLSELTDCQERGLTCKWKGLKSF